MGGDVEIDAMGTLAGALEPLEPEARDRVIRWAAERFGVKLGSSQRSRGPGGSSNDREADDREWEDLPSFFSEANPTTDAEKALVVGYWFQVVQGNADFESGKINTELKHLGHGVSNITRAFDDLKGRKPALAIQTQKSGKAKQARKKYKVTDAGVKRVRALLRAEGSEDEQGG